MKLRTSWVVPICLLFACAIAFWGCSNSTIKISFPGGTALAIDQGQSITITAATANDSGEGVSWTCTGAACTALTGATTTQVTFTANGATGTATITATSTKQNTITGTVTITVNALPSVSTTQTQVTAAPATGGAAYSFTLASAGGSGTLIWSATGLPIDGLSLNSTTGVISGTPTAHGSFVVMLTVTDTSAAGAKSSSTVTVTITVNNPAPPAITTSQSAVSAGAAGLPYAFTFQASGTGPLTWSAVGLSDGLSIGPSTGLVSGTPTSPAMVSFTLTASDSFGQSSPAVGFVITVTASYTLTVADLGTGNGSVTSGPGQISCSDAGGVVTGICSAIYANGAVVTLTAAATGTSKFNMWGGACSGTGTCMVTMNAPVSVTASFSPPPASVTLPPFTPTNAIQTASFNCTSGPSCTDANSHTLQLAVGQVNAPFTMTVTATEVPLSQASGVCQSGNTPSTDFDCRFASFFGALQGNGDMNVPQCDAYANGNCVFYSVYYCVPQGSTCVPTPGQEPPANMYQSPVNWQIEFNNTAYTPPAGYQTTPRLYDDPDYAVSSTTPFGTNCATPMTLNGSPTSPAIFCQFLFDITTNPDIAGRTLQFNDVVVAFPLAASIVSPNLSIVETADAATVSAGNPIGFTTAVSNSSAPGTGSANSVALTDPLPAGAGVNWSVSPANSACSIAGAVGSQVLSCAFGNLAPANTDSVHVISSSSSIGTYTNMATASATNNTPSQINGSATITVIASTMSIAFTPALPTSLAAGGTQSVNATVSNDSGSGGVNWTVTCSSAGVCGSFTSTHTASGISTTYNAPASVPAGNTVTITATAADPPSPLVSATVTITPLPIQVTFASTPPPNLVVSGTTNLTANVANDGTNAGVDWTVTCGSAQCGSFNPTHTSSGALTVYTAPSTMPTGQSVTITAKSTANSAQLAQAIIFITNVGAANCTGAPTGHESMLSGQYAFVAQGFSGSGTGTPQAYAGSFAADGHGNLVNLGGGAGGEVDINDAGGTPSYSHLTITTAGSSYTVGLDPTGSGSMACVILATPTGSATFEIGLNGVYPAIASKGRIIEYDDPTGTGSHTSGILRLQDPTAFSTGDTTHLKSNYAFGLDGWDPFGNHFANAGSLAFNPVTGAITNFVGDTDDAGTLSSATPGQTGTVTSVSSTTGRALVQVTSPPPGGSTSHSTIYIVNANEFFVIGTDPFSGGTQSVPIQSGRVFATGSSFSQSSLSGNYVIHGTGADSGVADVNIGLLNLTAGNVNGTNYEYESGNAQSPDTISGTYTVDPASGRTPFTDLAAGDHAPVLYLVTPAVDGISAFIVGTDSSSFFGFAEASSGTFSTAGLAGNYFFGTEDPGDSTVTSETGVVNLSSSGTCNGTQAQSGQSGLSTGSVSGGTGCLFTITDPNGTGNVGTDTVAITNGTKIFFFDEGQSGNSPAKITVLEQQ